MFAPNFTLMNMYPETSNNSLVKHIYDTRIMHLQLECSLIAYLKCPMYLIVIVIIIVDICTSIYYYNNHCLLLTHKFILWQYNVINS